jgi:uncharacterized protein YdeI (YjbR/CyaY-like superfamily)
VIAFESRAAWEAWLAEHHATSGGLRLKLAKKAARMGSVSYEDAVDVALCYGWIDGQAKGLNNDYWTLRFTPRRPNSKWSKRNCAKALGLMEQGRMQAAGVREIERAKADGRWEAAYEGQRAASVPKDLQKELDQNVIARAFFSTLDRKNRYAILYRIQDAKMPETRARRIARFVAMLNARQKIYP